MACTNVIYVYIMSRILNITTKWFHEEVNRFLGNHRGFIEYLSWNNTGNFMGNYIRSDDL